MALYLVTLYYDIEELIVAEDDVGEEIVDICCRVNSLQRREALNFRPSLT